METLKILVFNWRCWLNPKMGGAEVFAYEVTKRWVEAGHEVTLFTSKFPGCRGEEVVGGIRIVRAGGRLSVYWKAKEYFKNCFQHDFDMVVEGINTIPFFTPVYIRQPKVSLIFQLTGEVFHRVLPKPIATVAQHLEPLVYKKFYRKTVVLVLSESVKEELMRIGFFPENIFVAEPGVDSEYYTLGVKTKNPSILYLNRVVPYKNVDHLIEAFQIVKSKVPNAKLYIVGCRGTTYESDLQMLTKELGLVKAIEFHGFLSGETKRRFLQSAWVHVLPSTKEGWGISVLEAASCGTPTVAYDVVGLRDSIENDVTGLLVPFGDVDVLATAIIEIVTDERLRVQMSENAREWALQFPWDRTAKTALSALEYAMNHNIR